MSFVSTNSNRFLTRTALLIAAVAVGTLALSSLPTLASATPADYTVSRGFLQVSVSRPDFRGRTRLFRMNLPVSAGQFTHDGATGVLSQLSVTSGGQQVDLSPFASQAGSVHVIGGAQSSRVLLTAGGVAVPGNLFGGSNTANVRVFVFASVSSTSAPVVSVGPANAVPEPAAALVFGGGVLAAGWGVRRNRQTFA